MALANLYLVGAPKAGTTSIAAWLAEHPDVFWSTPKEPFFWASDYPRMRAHYGFETQIQYERLYSSPAAQSARIRGDGSTTYLYSEVAVPDIVQQVPEAKFVVCLRRPADLLTSYHRTQVVAMNEEENDFAVAWRRSADGRQPRTDPLDLKLVDYQLVGRLGAAVERLSASVDRRSVHFVLFDDLVASPQVVWAQVADFAGIDPAHSPSFVVRNSSDKTYRSATVRRFLHRPPAPLQRPMSSLRQWSRTTSLPGVARLKQRAWKTAPRPATSFEADAVSSYFADDTALLARMICRDLSCWARSASATELA